MCRKLVDSCVGSCYSSGSMQHILYWPWPVIFHLQGAIDDVQKEPQGQPAANVN